MLDYDPLAAEYAEHRSGLRWVIEALHEGGRLGRHSRVLEVGCGTGNYLAALARHTGCAGAGVDPSPEMLARARQQAPWLRFERGAGESLPFRDGEFDFVFSVDVIHHLVDPAAYVFEAFRVLCPGGRMCTVTESPAMIRARQPWGIYFPEVAGVDLARYPTPRALRTWMRQAGFKSIRASRLIHHYRLTDVQAYRDRAFSCLHLVPESIYRRGLALMEADLRRGPIPAVSRYLLLGGLRSKRGRRAVE